MTSKRVVICLVFTNLASIVLTSFLGFAFRNRFDNESLESMQSSDRALVQESRLSDPVVNVDGYREYRKRLENGDESIGPSDSSITQIFDDLLSEEEIASSYVTLSRTRVAADYLPLCHILNLDEEESKQLIGILNAAFVGGFESVTESQRKGEGLLEAADRFEEGTKSSMDRVKEFLSAEQYTEFEDYQRNARVRSMVETFVGKSFSMDKTLSKSEYEEMLMVLVDADQYDQRNGNRELGGERVWLGYEAALDLLGEQLDDGQFALLQNLVRQRIGELKVMEKANARFGYRRTETR